MANFNEEVNISLTGDWNNGGPSIGQESLIVQHSENGISPAVTFMNAGGGHFVFRFVFGDDAGLPGGEAASLWAGWQGLEVSAQSELSFVVGQRGNAPKQMIVTQGKVAIDGVTTIGNNVGIGTDTPAINTDVFNPGNPPITIYGPAKLHIVGNPNLRGTVHFEADPGKGPNLSHVHYDTTGDWYIRSAADNGKVVIQDQNPAAFVGIGTSSPTAKLEVAGDLKVSGDVFLTGGADCAEDFDINHNSKAEPGSVMVMNSTGKLEEGHEAYDKRVAGVISGAGNFKPAITLDKQETESNRQPIALLGKVYCKVDAQYAAIEVGDLLTTSSTPGHAMKALDPFKAFGAVIGKALGALTEGRGLIPILVTLQ